MHPVPDPYSSRVSLEKESGVLVPLTLQSCQGRDGAEAPTSFLPAPGLFVPHTRAGKKGSWTAVS